MPLGPVQTDSEVLELRNLIPAGPNLDIGSANNPWRDIYVSGSVLIPDLKLNNNDYLQAKDFAGTGLLDLLKADASDNTVLNAKTGKKISFDIASVEIANVALTGLHLDLAKGLYLKGGSNARIGSFTINGTSAVTVSNTSITANSVILFGLKSVSGTVGAIPVVQTLTAGTGFTVKGTAADASDYWYVVIENE